MEHCGSCVLGLARAGGPHDNTRTVSAANVDLVRRVYDALLRDDLDAALEFMDEEIEYVNPDYAVEPGRRYGHVGIRANVENMRVSFDYWQFRPEEFIDAGDQVAVIGTFRARGRDSGLEIERPQSRLWTIRDGKIVRYQWFDGPDEALRASGLRAE
jgi:ketosteroid isomerase-like protein